MEAAFAGLNGLAEQGQRSFCIREDDLPNGQKRVLLVETTTYEIMTKESD